MATWIVFIPVFDYPTYIAETLFWNSLTNVPLWLLSIPAMIVAFTSTDYNTLLTILRMYSYADFTISWGNVYNNPRAVSPQLSALKTYAAWAPVYAFFFALPMWVVGVLTFPLTAGIAILRIAFNAYLKIYPFFSRPSILCWFACPEY